ncbi:MAG: diguanylate cyclase [Colwellia sp.]|nr:diguanylate cyclase [Colwellia sp.]
MKKLIAFIILMSIVFGASAAKEKVIVQLRWHHQFQFAGYYAAIAKNFYQNKGIDVELKPLQQGMSPVKEVIENRAQFSQSGVGLLVDLAEGKKVSAIAATFQNSPIIFLTTEQSNIKKVQDIKDKRVMLSPENQSLELLVLLQKFGLTDKIDNLLSSFDINDLVQGNTDTFNAYLSNEPYQLELMGITPKIIDPKDYDIDFYGDVIFTTQEYIKEKPEVVAAFREATIEGWKYAINHPEEIIELILKDYGTTKTKDHLRFEANVLREIMMLDFVEIGHMNKERWSRNLEQLKSIGLVKQSINLDKFIYTPPQPINYSDYLRWIVLSILVMSIAVLLLMYFAYINNRLRLEVKRRREAEINALYKATHDPLTGLPNRYLFQDRLEQIILQKKRLDITPLMIFMDLDNFKQVNDRFGHDKGDQLLVQTGKVLSECLREGDTCARIAGDEFIILINECQSIEEAQEMAERLMDALELLYKVQDPTDKISASMGILLLDNIESSNELYKIADRLMYKAKQTQDQHFIIEKVSAVV